MRLKSDYRKIYAVFAIGAFLLFVGGWAASGIMGDAVLIKIGAVLIPGLLFLGMGFLVRSRYYLTDKYIEMSNIIGLRKKRILLSDIKRVKFISGELPVMANVNNPMWLILWDNKFKRMKQLELYDGKKIIARIDGHLLSDNDFESLKKKIK